MARKKAGGGSHEEKSTSIIRKLLYGQVVTSDFFARNWVAMLVVLFCFLTFISGKYTCMTKMEESQRLERKVDETHKEFVRVRSEYMGKIRESAVKQQIDSMRLHLELQERPPYKLVIEQ